LETTETIFGKHRAFTASQQNIVIVGAKSKYMEGIAITINWLQNTATAPTIAEGMALVNPVTIDVGGTNEINIRYVDLLALNILMFGIQPEAVISVSDNNEGYVNGIWLPCWFPPTTEETKASFTFAAITNGDNSELSATAHFLEGIPRREALHYTEFQVNTAGIDDTSLNNWTHLLDLVGDAIGVLLFETTVNSASVLFEDGTLQQVAVDVDGTEKLNYEWHEISALPKIFAGQAYNNFAASPNSLALIDNYKFLPLMREPIPAKSQMKIRAMAGITAEAVRDEVIQAIRY
jgi:hypothetical protein